MIKSVTLKKYIRAMAKAELGIMTSHSDEERKKHEKDRDYYENEILAIIEDKQRTDISMSDRRDKWHQ